jgi:antitoxin StbD
MTKLLTPHIATMTEMREPHKVLERSGGNPVAVLKNSALVGYFVPAEAVQETESRVATRDEVLGSLKRRKDVNQPVLDYLKDNDIERYRAVVKSLKLRK